MDKHGQCKPTPKLSTGSMDTSLLGEHELGRFQVVEHVYLCWPWFNQWGGGRNQNKPHKLNRIFGGSAIPLSGLSLGTNTIEMQLVWRIFPATSLVERIFPETSAFWRMLQATSLAMQDMLWNRFAEPQKHRTFQRLSVSPKMFGKKTNLLPVS